MSQLKELRKRIQSTKSVKQITKAMEMVAASHFRKASEKAKSSRPFAEKLKEMLNYLSFAEKTNPFFSSREIKKTLVIIVAGEKGLSGAYNNNILHAADEFLSKYQPAQVELVLIGSKVVDYFRNKKWSVHKEIAGRQGKFSLDEIKEMTNEWVEEYSKGTYDEIQLIYTHFVNALSRNIVIEKFLNIDRAQPEGEILHRNYIFEPSQERVLKRLIPLYCLSLIQQMLNDAWASELSSRVQSMRAATNNAEEMLVKLTLIRNKVRQEGITKEILEITSGAESAKS